MAARSQNSTEQVTEFILIGFQFPRSIQIFLFPVLLLVLLLTLAGNVTIIALVYLDQCLQTPMYFFLCNLSLLEMFFILTVTPKMLVNMLFIDKAISFLGCAIQCYFYFSLGATEIILIAVMSFDRYVAICHPLHYTIIMDGHVCIFLVLGCWLSGILSMIGPMILLFHPPFCGSIIDHFFCDYAPIIKLSCRDMQVLLTLESVLSAVMLLISLSVTAVSYLYIIATTLRMHTTSSLQKTFSTCASHITVASVFYGSSIFMYSLPSHRCSQNIQKTVAILTAVVTPLLNPFIYALRNEKVKEAFSNALKRQN